jgi:hypothetical protein
MELKTQIKILTSTSKEDLYSLIWKDEDDLINQLEIISQSFQDSESITPVKTICFSILNGYKERIKTYGGMEFDMESLSNKMQNSEIPDVVMNALNRVIKSENCKVGNHILTLNPEEIYQLFSLQEFRNSKLSKILF